MCAHQRQQCTPKLWVRSMTQESHSRASVALNRVSESGSLKCFPERFDRFDLDKAAQRHAQCVVCARRVGTPPHRLEQLVDRFAANAFARVVPNNECASVFCRSAAIIARSIAAARASEPLKRNCRERSREGDSASSRPAQTSAASTLSSRNPNLFRRERTSPREACQSRCRVPARFLTIGPAASSGGECDRVEIVLFHGGLTIYRLLAAHATRGPRNSFEALFRNRLFTP